MYSNLKSCLSILLLIAFVACNSKPQEKPSVLLTPQYYFYPKANVYFDSANKAYSFLGTDGRTWQTVQQIPSAMQALMDKTALISNPSNPVWKDNERHKLIYSALLYASPADTQAAKPVVPVLTPTEEKKEPKGLKKFLQKIFGRKKKDTTNK